MLPRLVCVIVLLCAAQAQALSCMQSDIARSFERFDAASERYIVAFGRFEGGDPPPHVDDMPVQPDRMYQASFKGYRLTRNGFNRALSETVTVHEVCLSVWCGAVPMNIPVLVFLQTTEHGYEVEENACGGAVFHNPSKADLARVHACLIGRKDKCEAPGG